MITPFFHDIDPMQTKRFCVRWDALESLRGAPGKTEFVAKPPLPIDLL